MKRGSPVTAVLKISIEDDRYILQDGRSFFDELIYEAICRPRPMAVTARVIIAITVSISIIVVTSFLKGGLHASLCQRGQPPP